MANSLGVINKKLLLPVALLIFLELSNFTLFAQVSNNSIRDRFELKLNTESTHSTTANATVEWSCINKAPFLFTSKGRVEIFVINKADNDLLDYSVREFVMAETLSIDLTKFVDYGIQQFWIKLRHTKSKELKQYIFMLNEAGEPVLKEGQQ